MKSREIRQRFLSFFEKRGHTVIQSASLVTPDEKGLTNATLFNTAGMQPLVPYLLGKPYTIGGTKATRLVDVQKCLRTNDIDGVGDKTHHTFFQMLGNWSLGDYFKREAIEWSFEFLTSKSEGLGLDPARLYVSVFEGDANAPRDDEAAAIWQDVFTKNNVDFGGDTSKGEAGRIFYLPASNNWWEAGDNGPCGPDTEMFYDIKDTHKGALLNHKAYVAADDAQEIVEVWNDVFMQYEKKDGKIIGKLPKPSVDTGAGLERLTITLSGSDNTYDTDLFKPVMDLMKEESIPLRSKRIIADHMRASIFLITDGVIPSNTDRGYILRRFIRRAVMNTADKKLDAATIARFVDTFVSIYKEGYPELAEKSEMIMKVLAEESAKFAEALILGLKEFEKGVDAFTLFSSYGFPLELTLELAKEKGIKVDVKDFEEKFKKHQDLSRSGAEQKFKGGLADANDPMVVRYHTATHLLQQALHDVLGEELGSQKGSNITPERLRYDFNGIKLTDEQKKKVEEIVNEKIAAKLPVNQIILPRDEAEKTGARHFFGEKYGDQISVYFIGPIAGANAAVSDLSNAYSKEFCGGPHVKNTFELAGPEGKWHFKIQKEEASSQGIRRIKAVLG
ncbi:MAG: alanine--tRNA ligase [Candidatus Pacebacteria bacterium]|nr:alanine--tRNA ligase [Candidatus Paceibacterota bacterium]